MKTLIKLTLSGILIGFVGCSSSITDSLNPYAENAPKEQGQRNSKALFEEIGISGSGGESGQARHALEVMGSYRSAQAPAPTYPVLQPAEVRLMWVPDHLNRSGDLVPSHYYYLKVLHDRWAVQDAFEIERQLGEGDSSTSSAVPWKQAE